MDTALQVDRRICSFCNVINGPDHAPLGWDQRADPLHILQIYSAMKVNNDLIIKPRGPG